jgi:hypothetical protein
MRADSTESVRAGDERKRVAIPSGVTTDKVAGALVIGALLLLILLRRGFLGALGD